MQKTELKYSVTVLGEVVSVHETFKDAYIHYHSELTNANVKKRMAENYYIKTGNEKLIPEIEKYHKMLKSVRIAEY